MVSKRSQPSILFINRVYPPSRGASGRMLRDLARQCAQNGWRVTVLCAGAKTSEDKDGKIRIKRVKAAITSKSALSYGYVWLKLLWAAKSMPKLDVVVTLTDPPMTILIGRIFSKLKKCPHMHWCHDLYPDLLPYVGLKLPAPLMQSLKKSTRRSMKKCDKVV
ncbi:MAG: glycosyltransferase, partial [Pseudomonadota bacterium]